MSKMRSSLSPERWSTMPRRGLPRLQDNRVLAWQRFDYKTRPEPKNFEVNDYSRTTFDSPNQNDNAMRHFNTGKVLNDDVARRYCAKYNHPVRNIKQDRALVRAKIAYWESLEYFNICYNCECPIKTRRETVTHKNSKYGDQKVAYEFADIPEHHRCYQDRKGKMRYELIPAHRVLHAEKCKCIVSQHRKDAKIDLEFQKSLDYFDR
jgi:hypothetical protein